MAKSDPSTTEQSSVEFDDIPHERAGPRPDFSKPPPRTRLPGELQSTLDSEEKLWETLYEGRAGDSTESDVRYAAYAARIRTILLSAHRYVAYTSDVGESFRPVAHPWLIRGAYGVSWAYLIGDVAHEGYKAYGRNQRAVSAQLAPTSSASADDKVTEGIATAVAAAKSLPKAAPTAVPSLEDYRTIMAQRAIFQGVASMGLPAFTIHSIVRYSGRALKDVKNTRLRTWGPIGLGLAAVPALPYMFDAPVEHAVEWLFHTGFSLAGAGGHAKEKEL